MKTIIFTNEWSRERENDARQYLFEEYGESSNWKSADDIPDSKVYDELASNEEIEWDDFESVAKNFFLNKPGRFLLMGNIGTWHGNCLGGFIFSKFDELRKAWNNCDYITITDDNGHFKIRASHHDGANYYEVRHMTEAGEHCLENYENKHAWDNYSESEIHTKLFENSKYTHCLNFLN